MEKFTEITITDKNHRKGLKEKKCTVRVDKDSDACVFGRQIIILKVSKFSKLDLAVGAKQVYQISTTLAFIDTLINLWSKAECKVPSERDLEIDV